MKKSWKKKLEGRSGIAAVVVILALLVLLLSVGIAIPVYRNYREQADEIGCVSSLTSANNQLSIEYLSAGELTAVEAKAIVTKAMNGWDDLCPVGGTPYLVAAEGEVPWRVVCGLHDKDTKERTRLNAANVLKQLRRKVDLEQKLGDPTPPEVTVTLNGKEYRALLTEQETGLKRGTATTSGVKGTVIYYSLSGYGAFAENISLPDGSVCYFSFADEEHCATWRHQEGWSGDSYE